MKKIILTALVCNLLATNVTNAQVNTDTYYGSKEGGFAITIGARPIIDYVGNLFNDCQDNSLSELGGSIAGKYFLNDNLALTAELNIDNSQKTKFYYGNYNEPEDITSKKGDVNNDFTLGIGGQYLLRPGKRLQPFVGASILYGRTNKYDFNKELEYKFNNNNNKQEKSLKKNGARSNMFGLMANIGVEYFFMKNISISTELGLGVHCTTYKNFVKFKTNDDDITKEEIEKMNYNKKTDREVALCKSLNNGNIALNFYF